MNTLHTNDSAYAGDYLRRLMAAESVEQPDLNRLNGLGAPIQALYAVKQANDPDGLQRAFNAFCNTNPGLKALLKGNTKRFYHADELHLLPRPEYLPNAAPLYKQCMNMLVGQTGTGKSFVALHWALMVAQYAPVIYIAAEGAAGYRDRVSAWKMATKLPAGQLYFAPEDLQIVSATSVQGFVEGVQNFLEIVNHLSPQLVVIDTLARCFGSGDENSAEDMGEFIRGLTAIQNGLGAATLTLHHTTKTGYTERGSGALRSACDCVIDLHETDGLIKLVNSKNKQYTVLDNLALETFREAGAKSSVLVKVTGIGDNSLFRVLSTLKTKGYITQGAKGDPFKITPEGLKAIGQ